MSPSTVVLYPPDPLVIKVETTDRYAEVIVSKYGPDGIKGLPYTLLSISSIGSSRPRSLPIHANESEGVYYFLYWTDYITLSLFDLTSAPFNMIAVVNVQYNCTGSNHPAGNETATITVQLLGIIIISTAK